MNYEVKILPPAIEDLQRIASSSKTEANAKQLISNIKQEIENLSQMPDAYRLYKDEPWHSRGLRLFPVDKYLVFYIINEESKIVNVLRIISGKMNLSKLAK